MKIRNCETYDMPIIKYDVVMNVFAMRIWKLYIRYENIMTWEIYVNYQTDDITVILIKSCRYIKKLYE